MTRKIYIESACAVSISNKLGLQISQNILQTSQRLSAFFHTFVQNMQASEISELLACLILRVTSHSDEFRLVSAMRLRGDSVHSNVLESGENIILCGSDTLAVAMPCVIKNGQSCFSLWNCLSFRLQPNNCWPLRARCHGGRLITHPSAAGIYTKWIITAVLQWHLRRNGIIVLNIKGGNQDNNNFISCTVHQWWYQPSTSTRMAKQLWNRPWEIIKPHPSDRLDHHDHYDFNDSDCKQCSRLKLKQT